MRIQHSSDLHLEFGSKKYKYLVQPGVDVHVFAGDCHTNPESLRKFFLKVRALTDKPIVYTFGNHEFYGHDIASYKQNYVDSLAGLVHLLDDSVVEIGGRRFIGSCLYSDLSNPLDALSVASGMTDFIGASRGGVDDGGAPMSPASWTQRHRTTVEFFKREMREGDIVVTHFSPSFQHVEERFRGDRSSAGYHTELYWLMEEKRPALWIWGHTHSHPCDLLVADTRTVCNQRGYPHEELHYAPRIVEV